MIDNENTGAGKEGDDLPMESGEDKKEKNSGPHRPQGLYNTFYFVNGKLIDSIGVDPSKAR